MTAMEAIMRIYGRPAVKLSHPVYKMWVHTPGSANLIVEEGREHEAEAAAHAALEGEGRRTMLTTFLEKCANPETQEEIAREGYVPGPCANELLYEEFPRYYNFVRTNPKRWERKKRFIGTEEEFIGRLGSVNPRNSELTAVRILLQHTRGTIPVDLLNPLPL